MSTPHLVTRASCPVCGSEGCDVLFRSPYSDPDLAKHLLKFYAPAAIDLSPLDGGFYALARCTRCGLVYQQQVPSPDLAQTLYEDWIDSQRAREAHRAAPLQPRAQTVSKVMQLVAALGGGPGDLRMLDFGMGWGEWVLCAKALGCDARGVEISRPRVENARTLGLEIMDFDDIPGQDFHCINAEQVFEHLDAPAATLAHLARGLRSGGLIRIGVPRADDIERRLKAPDWDAPTGHKRSLNPVAPLEHVNLFNVRSLATLAENAGLIPTRLPRSVQYAYATGWTGPKAIAKNLLRPLFAQPSPGGLSVLLRKP